MLELVDRYHTDGVATVFVQDGEAEHTVRIEDHRGELTASEAPEHVCEWVLAQDAIAEFARVRIDAWLADNGCDHDRVTLPGGRLAKMERVA
jgi:hypothetical protein